MSDIARIWKLPDTPKGWRLVQPSEDGGKYLNHSRGLGVILSVTVEDDGKPWVHFSLSHKNRIPTWGELRTTKEAFLGNVHAYQVLPPTEIYVNLNPKVLHLFTCLDGPQLPEFSGVIPGVGRSL